MDAAHRLDQLRLRDRYTFRSALLVQPNRGELALGSQGVLLWKEMRRYPLQKHPLAHISGFMNAKLKAIRTDQFWVFRANGKCEESFGAIRLQNFERESKLQT